MMIYIALQTLEFLKKGGRVTPAAAALGSVFNIKPILKLQTGKLDSFKKCHGMQKAKKTAIEAMQTEIRENFQDALNDGALHLLASSSGTDEENAAWVEEIKEVFPGVPSFMITFLSAFPAISDLADGELVVRWHRL